VETRVSVAVLYVGKNLETIDLLRKIFGVYNIEMTVVEDIEKASTHLKDKKRYYTVLLIETYTTRKEVEFNNKEKKQDGVIFADHQCNLNGERVIVLYDSFTQCSFLTRFVSFSRYNLSDTKDYLVATILGMTQIRKK